MFDTETWKFINTFAPWLSAIGTLIAVIVTIYLSRKDKTVKLKVGAGVRMMIGDDFMGEPKYLTIYITNVGLRETKVTSIGWKVGYFKKQYAVQGVINDGFSSKLPIKLNDGEEAHYHIPLDKATNWIDKFVQQFLINRSKISFKFIKIQVFVSTGDKFESRIENNLKEKLLESYLLKKRNRSG